MMFDDTQLFMIQERQQTDDGIGGFEESWVDFKPVSGYLDLITGTNQNTLQNAFTEQSTHILVVPEYTNGITDKMRVIDANQRWYSVTYVDDPVGIHDHIELYLTYGGVLGE